MPTYLTEETVGLNIPDFNICTLKNLKPITVLFGKNGSGKSEVLRGFSIRHHLKAHYCSPEKGGSPEFQPGLHQEQLNKNITRRRSNFNENYFGEVVTRIAVFLQVRGGREPVLEQPNLKTLELQLQTLIPTPQIRLLRNHPYIQTDTNLTTLSSGEKQLLGLGLDILTQVAIWKHEDQDFGILLVDEPDAHLHPDSLINFSHFLKNIQDTYSVQIILATHSPSLLSALGADFKENLGIVYLKRGVKEQTAINFSETYKSLITVLGGHALMGPLFNVPMLLVEGEDDNSLWSQVPRHHQYGFTVLPCAGSTEVKKNQKQLETIFESLLEPVPRRFAGYALLDNDTSKPTEDSHPQRHVKFLQLKCHEIENLYLTDEVLEKMGIDWNIAKEKIKLAADGEHKTMMLDVENWDRSSINIKPIIKKLQKILDGKDVHWWLRVAQYIGNTKPINGQIEEFLGEDVMYFLAQCS